MNKYIITSSHKKRKQFLFTFIKNKGQREKLYKIVRVGFFVFVIVLFVVILFIKILQYTIFAPQNYFRSVKISQNSKQTYNDPYLYADIQDALSGMNKYFYFARFQSRLIHLIHHQYPMVANITPLTIGYANIVLDVSFLEPELVIQNNDDRRGVYSDRDIIPLYSGDRLGKDQIPLYLPRYLSGQQSFTGLFYTIGVKKLQQQFHSILTQVPDVLKVVYFAGGEKLVAITKDYQKIFFNCEKDIDKQIEKYITIKNDRFVRISGLQWTDVTQIDLGSLEQPIIMTK